MPTRASRACISRDRCELTALVNGCQKNATYRGAWWARLARFEALAKEKPVAVLYESDERRVRGATLVTLWLTRSTARALVHLCGGPLATRAHAADRLDPGLRIGKQHP